MKQKYYVLLVLVLIAVIGAYFYQQNTVSTSNIRTYPPASNFDFYSIHEIKQNKVTSGTYDTEGYVVKIYTCPPCPKDALCKMCVGANIVVSEENKLLETYSLTEKEMVIFTVNSNPNQFELGKKYRFSIRITERKSTGEPINDVELVGYDKIE